MDRGIPEQAKKIIEGACAKFADTVLEVCEKYISVYGAQNAAPADVGQPEAENQPDSPETDAASAETGAPASAESGQKTPTSETDAPDENACCAGPKPGSFDDGLGAMLEGFLAQIANLVPSGGGCSSVTIKGLKFEAKVEEITLQEY